MYDGIKGRQHEKSKSNECWNEPGEISIPSFVAHDFLERNRKKFDKVSSVQDEVAQFSQGTLVKFRADEDGYVADPLEYVVVRARRTISGKREYWLARFDSIQYCPNGGKPNVARKVGGSNLLMSRQMPASMATKFATLKLPRAI